ncbi:uncharacterized protein LOC100678849 isoform X1 [Nasonia vitripennis]|uniref:Uncharacterized protein n=1 Tax=Nasonia vitripennis TaxID=7425 RepID=A0A7M7QZ81_NASVI|nr:uncharacterized protein LOC100678849 isoform X1 [Nasonia vitripennis]XP_032455876.1 uncharacterized protein LOC100678849 isoform X1 [Nasonia vitripennis]
MYSLIPRSQNRNQMRSLAKCELGRYLSTACVKFSERRSQGGLFSRLRNVFQHSEYEFSKPRFSRHKRCTLRKNSSWAVSAKQIKFNPMLLKDWEFFQKSCMAFVYKRNASDLSIENPKPPIRDPSMPEGSKKKDEKKKDKKDKKPVMYAAEDSSESQSTKTPANEIKQIFRNKWGVKLIENVNISDENARTYMKSISSPQWGVNLNSSMDENKLFDTTDKADSSKVRLALVSKGNEEMDKSYVKRPKRQGDEFTVDPNFALYYKTGDEFIDYDEEYYVPMEMSDKEVATAWKELVVNSKRPKAKEDEATPVELQEVESIFIRPEPPAPKLDVKSIKSSDISKSSSGSYTQTAHFSTCTFFMTPITTGNESSTDSFNPNVSAFHLVEEAKNSEETVFSPSILLPSRPLSPIESSYEAFREDDDEFLENLTTSPDTALDFANDDRITQSITKEQLHSNMKEFEAMKENKTYKLSGLSIEDRAFKNSEQNYDGSIMDGMRLSPLNQFHVTRFDKKQYTSSANDDADEMTTEYTIEGDTVKVNGDPYPYSKEHFEKWRSPKTENFNIH